MADDLVIQFPADAPKLLLVDIVERTCRAAVIHEVASIGRCMKVYDDKGEFTVSTALYVFPTSICLNIRLDPC